MQPDGEEQRGTCSRPEAREIEGSDTVSAPSIPQHAEVAEMAFRFSAVKEALADRVVAESSRPELPHAAPSAAVLGVCTCSSTRCAVPGGRTQGRHA